MKIFSKQSVLTGHQGAIYCTSASGKHILTAGSDGWIAAWDLSTGIDGNLLAKVPAQVFSLVSLSDTMDQMVAGDMNGVLHWVFPGRQELTKSIQAHKTSIFDLVVYGDYLISLGGDGRMIFWDKEHMMPIETIQLTDKALRKGKISPDGNTLAIAASDGQIYLMDLEQKKIRQKIYDAHLPSVFCLAFHPTKPELLSGGRDAHIKVWDLDGDCGLNLDIAAHWFTVNDLLIMREEQILISASRDKTVRVWDLNDYSLLQTLGGTAANGHSHSVNCLIANEKGFFSTGDDRKLIYWA